MLRLADDAVFRLATVALEHYLSNNQVILGAPTKKAIGPKAAAKALFTTQREPPRVRTRKLHDTQDLMMHRLGLYRASTNYDLPVGARVTRSYWMCTFAVRKLTKGKTVRKSLAVLTKALCDAASTVASPLPPGLFGDNPDTLTALLAKLAVKADPRSGKTSQMEKELRLTLKSLEDNRVTFFSVQGSSLESSDQYFHHGLIAAGAAKTYGVSGKPVTYEHASAQSVGKWVLDNQGDLYNDNNAAPPRTQAPDSVARYPFDRVNHKASVISYMVTYPAFPPVFAAWPGNDPFDVGSHVPAVPAPGGPGWLDYDGAYTRAIEHDFDTLSTTI